MPHPGWGEPRESRYTQDEQRTEFTLFAIARSPLIYGGNLTKLDDFSRGLMTNKDLIEINQYSGFNHPVLDLPSSFQNVRVWTAITGMPENGPNLYYAFFNLDDKPTTLHFEWAAFHYTGKHSAMNILGGSTSGPSETMDLTLPAHGSAVYLVK